jgi:hypothetical protein
MNFTIELRTKADQRLAAICHEAATGKIQDMRTKLDEWKAFVVGGSLVGPPPRLRQRWLNNPCPWEHHDRLRKHMDWITPLALQILQRGEQKDPAVKKPKKGRPAPYRLIVEHAVPVRVLRELILADRALWEREPLERFLERWFRRGVLTKDEDDLLNAAGLRQDMPAGWRLGDDPFARYGYVGLQRADQTSSTNRP